MAIRKGLGRGTGKRYEAYWGSGYFKKGKKIVSPKFFTQSNGYTPQDIHKIKTMSKGKKTNLSDLSGTHIVKRIK